MSEYKFKFPLLHGGRECGLNDAGIQTFNSNPLEKLARECAQNSLDARFSNNLPARLSFKLHYISLNDIPGADDLKEAFEQCKEYWDNGSADRQADEFNFSNTALQYFEKETIPVLEISDYNTTGLDGNDDDRGSSWHALVMSAGQCNKSSDNAGGFGIGKFAPFATSAWRTVFYTSFNRSGQYAFRGVCNNLTHRNSNGEKTQAVGYYGLVENDEIKTIRDYAGAPEIYWRGDYGTSIFVLAFEHDKDWSKRLEKAVLENFWPAIYFNKISFDIDGKEISQSNLASYLAQYDDLSLFLQCLEGEDKVYIKETVDKLGECELFLLLPKSDVRDIVCTRSSRMKIQSISRSDYRGLGVGYVGLFSCLSDEGNKILKSMEPPEHNKWDYERSNDIEIKMSTSEKKDLIKKLKNWIREQIVAQLQKNNGEAVDLDDIGQHISVEDETAGDSSGGQENNDGFSYKQTEVSITRSASKVQTQATTLANVGGNEEGTSGITPANGGGGDTPHPSPGPHPRPGEPGGCGGNKPAGVATKVKIASKSYFSQNGEYVLQVTSPEEGFKGSLEISRVLENGDSEITKITEARAADGTSCAISSGRIAGIDLAPGEKLKLFFKIANNERFAIKVLGHDESNR